MTGGGVVAVGRRKVRINVAANYAARLWSIASVYVFVPSYVQLLGVGAYGLIAFYSVALAILFIADAGLSAAFGREAAHEQDHQRLRDLLASLEVLLFGIVGLAGGVFFAGAPWIVTHWLNTADSIAPSVAVDSLRFMAFALVPQIAMSLYFGGLMGLQKQVQANLIAVLFGLVRSGMVLVPIFLLPDVRVYFAWQAVSGWVFLFLMRRALRIALGTNNGTIGAFSWGVVRPVLAYAGGMLAMAIIAGINNQMDRLMVSKYLPLTDFTFYSLAAMISQIPAILTMPIATAVSPRLVALRQKSEMVSLREMYEKYTYAIAALGSTASFGLFFFGKQIVDVWLRGQSTPPYMSLVIQILAIGSLFLTLQLTPYHLSLANGHTRTNVRLGLCALLLSIPAQIALTMNYGAIGAAVPWLCINAAAFVYLGLSLNKKFNSGHTRAWFVYCAAPPVLISGVVFGAAKQLAGILGNSTVSSITLGLIFGLLSLLASFALWGRIRLVLVHRD